MPGTKYGIPAAGVRQESLLDIRPLYLRAAGGRIPELKRMIVAHQNQIVMEETLEAALSRLFAAERPARPGPVEPALAAASGLEDLAARAREHYALALKARRDGDWARYGEEINRLGEVLERMRQRPEAAR
jgi:uncharacterized membrane protein (UPF0182 family)